MCGLSPNRKNARAVFRQRSPPCYQRGSPDISLAARAFRLDHGSFNVHAALHRYPPPETGSVQFDWVTYHWVAGAVLTVSVIFHIIHASFWLDFWAIWPDKEDLVDASRRVRRFLGQPAPPPRKFAKYPLENKLYHGTIIAAGLTAIATGVFMMFRVRTVFFPRNPYLFGDMTWGMMYVLHGLAGVGLTSRW